MECLYHTDGHRERQHQETRGIRRPLGHAYRGEGGAWVVLLGRDQRGVVGGLDLGLVLLLLLWWMVGLEAPQARSAGSEVGRPLI